MNSTAVKKPSWSNIPEVFLHRNILTKFDDDDDDKGVSQASSPAGEGVQETGTEHSRAICCFLVWGWGTVSQQHFVSGKMCYSFLFMLQVQFCN